DAGTFLGTAPRTASDTRWAPTIPPSLRFLQNGFFMRIIISIIDIYACIVTHNTARLGPLEVISRPDILQCQGPPVLLLPGSSQSGVFDFDSNRSTLNPDIGVWVGFFYN